MAETVPAAPPPAPAQTKAPKKKAEAPKKKPTVSLPELILKAVSACTDRKGMSLAALKKKLAAGGYDVEGNRGRIVRAVKVMLLKGTLVHTRGAGAAGSFKVAGKPKNVPAKTSGAKPKSSPAKKPAGVKQLKTARKPTGVKTTPRKKGKPAGKKPAAKKQRKSKIPAKASTIKRAKTAAKKTEPKTKKRQAPKKTARK